MTGRGTVTVLKKEEKESHDIRQGDIMKVDAGSVVYVINSDSREKLIIAKLVNPVSTPGKFEVTQIKQLLLDAWITYLHKTTDRHSMIWLFLHSN